ncbi:MAG: hypothetical protein CMH59_09600, partial [Myxococcales bacterium]|nr:hypothetical protein [Myxococcales bacterium]
MSWGGLLSVIAAATLVAGCEMGRASTSGRADLQVLLRTDLTPQVEFVWIEVALPETGEVMRRAAVPVAYHRAAEVAYFRDLRPSPERLVEVRLLQRDGSVVLKRPLVFPHRGRLAVTARLTRSCREHDCPAACHGGFCVDPRCIDGDEVLCREGPDAPDVPRPGHVRECDTVADCALPVAACAIQVCDEGLCWAFPDDGACPEGRLCAPDIGCREAPPPLEVDAGMPDAGPPLEDGGGGPAL